MAVTWMDGTTGAGCSGKPSPISSPSLRSPSSPTPLPPPTLSGHTSSTTTVELTNGTSAPSATAAEGCVGRGTVRSVESATIRIGCERAHDGSESATTPARSWPVKTGEDERTWPAQASITSTLPVTVPATSTSLTHEAGPAWCAGVPSSGVAGLDCTQVRVPAAALVIFGGQIFSRSRLSGCLPPPPAVTAGSASSGWRSTRMSQAGPRMSCSRILTIVR
mmetsp:Transcript_52436/g.145786  ORF Transcript_52436/g.145786 Transcript_52436/m.145786 type:complete len:221 (-) Transcript_52436:611-1273(-)